MHRKILFVVFVCAALVHAEPSAYDLELVRQDSRFVEFEKFFDIEKIQKENILFCTSDRRGREEEFKRQSFLGGSVSKVCTVTGYKYKIYANPKAKMPFGKLFFEFVLKKESKTLNENPLHAVNLVNEIYKAVRKNPSFEKWLENKNLQLKNNEVTSVEFNRDENVWKKVGMFGEYMGTLKISTEMQFCGPNRWSGGSSCDILFFDHYNFMLSDDGDVLVSSIYRPNEKKLLDVVLEDSYSSFRMQECREPKSKRVSSYVEHMFCDYSIISKDYCVESLSKYNMSEFCDYIIIRNDGSIEYGPKSGNM
ncbi:hypothetical protein [Fibrobacter succinogenes]|uniref:hypothetical protein n=1 Tax=Fibrobacter succinogenes TaxID=833 RepID=UPI00156894A0|nr:hypothetical protein [Fibrobacter succinogenes]